MVGRFTSPDDILDVKHLARSDGLNRLAFENNDPINHTDPFGKWSLSVIFGAVIGAALVVGAKALKVATGGAAAPLAAAAAGAMAGGGIAGITYSFDHRNERGGKFWGGYAATVLVNAAIGGAAGALSPVAIPTRLASASGRLGQAAGWSLTTSVEHNIGRAASLGVNSLISATSSLLNAVAHNVIENQFYGTNYAIFERAGSAFVGGVALGAAAGAFSAINYKGIITALTKGKTTQNGVLGGLKTFAMAGSAVAKAENVPNRALHRVKQETVQIYHVQQTIFRALSDMVGPSGFVGALQQELMKNQSIVNFG